MITEMFLRFPAAKNTSADQVRVYVDDLISYPLSCVDRAIQATRRDPKRSKDYPPSADRIIEAIGRIGMNSRERNEYYRRMGKPLPVEYQPARESDGSQIKKGSREISPHIQAMIDNLKAPIDGGMT